MRTRHESGHQCSPIFFPTWAIINSPLAVDRWVFHDDVMFIKQGYINRNSILVNGAAYRFTVPITDQSEFRSDQ